MIADLLLCGVFRLSRLPSPADRGGSPILKRGGTRPRRHRIPDARSDPNPGAALARTDVSVALRPPIRERLRGAGNHRARAFHSRVSVTTGSIAPSWRTVCGATSAFGTSHKRNIGWAGCQNMTAPVPMAGKHDQDARRSLSITTSIARLSCCGWRKRQGFRNKMSSPQDDLRLQPDEAAGPIVR